MSIIDSLRFRLSPELPLLLQTEATECGLACLGMVAGYHGHHTDISSLRRQFPISLKGVTLAQLIQIARQLELAARPLTLELDQLGHLRLPCILHWELNHFVVLKSVVSRSLVIHDPAAGVRRISIDTASKCFTGVALELWPGSSFSTSRPQPQIKLRQLMGRISGMYRALLQVMLLALALEVFAVVTPLFLQWVIDNVIATADKDLLTTLALGFGLLVMAQAFVGFLRSRIVLYVGTTLNVQWRGNIFSHLLRLPISYFEKRHLGDIVSRFGSIEQINTALTTSFVEASVDGVMSVVTLVVMIFYSMTLTSIALMALVLYLLCRLVRYAALFGATRSQIVFSAKQQTHFLESLRGIKAIKLFQREDERQAGWLALLVEQINAGLRTQNLQLLYQLAKTMVQGLENVATIWLGARMAIDGHFTVGALMAFVSYRNQFDTRIVSLVDKAFQLKLLRIQGLRLADIVQTAPETRREAQWSTDRIMVPASIHVRGLVFRYAEYESNVLDGVDFDIESGESVAIVGPSGCGKTTLINVLLGILDPNEGEVLIGGLPLQSLGLDTVRSMASTVTQDDVLFAGSIADNISFFDPQADRARIEECARLAAIDTDIQAMPMGYNTLVGDMGTVLSGGEKQRVLLARALYKKPQILILDEATSHLDLERERAVNQAIKALRMTRLIIAHRPETIAMADRRIMLMRGRVVIAGGVDTRLSRGSAPQSFTNR